MNNIIKKEIARQFLEKKGKCMISVLSTFNKGKKTVKYMVTKANIYLDCDFCKDSGDYGDYDYCDSFQHKYKANIIIFNVEYSKTDAISNAKPNISNFCVYDDIDDVVNDIDIPILNCKTVQKEILKGE